ncbi:methylamine utilization protein MauE [Burkholderia sp. SRS-W-2-2016]|uniref:MauE/DoxX family redox-associated membrane protein n=1 Tax=Burkholderia sp. SRS-W-2-2016 TaxID=1926878 RepID=UPI00094B0790|nr:MauE/DoxX family redox-associated membrane protein [Burkholderia sp. SRS-W-2-2016]OLL30931.1 methylamine utilization protein MauE [Burkholderia sp. SRS-W-2-2016]
MNPTFAIDPVVSTAALAITSIVTLTLALPKLARQAELREAVAGFALLPQVLVAPVAFMLPLAEIGAVLAALVPATRVFGATALAALFVLFALALGINVARGRTDIDCGCNGFRQSGTHVSHSIGWAHVARSLLLAALAVLVCVPQSTRAVVWFDYLSVLGATLVAVAAFFTVDVLLVNRPKLNHLRNS